ncbi:EAL domain-containing protein [Persephonella sp.]
MFLERFITSLPIRITFPLVLFLAFVIVSIFEAYLEKKTSFRRIEEESREHICSITAEFQELSEYFISKNNLNLIERRIADLSANQFLKLILLVDPEGKVIISAQKKLKNDNLEDALKSGAKKYHREILSIINELRKSPKMICKISEDTNKILSVAPVLFPSETKKLRPSNLGFLIMMYDLEGIKEKHRKETLVILLSEFGVMLFLLGTIYLIFSKLIGERLETLLRIVREIKKGNLDIAIKLEGNDEFSLIARILNDLIRRLKTYIKYDSLTGIFNRFALEHNIKELLKESSENQRNILIFMDIDNFKEINDTFGHNFGDILLRLFAKRLRNVVKEGIVGRLGGDEFIIFLQDHGETNIQEMLNKWISELTSPYKIKDNIIEISITAGITVHQGKDGDFYQLLKESDIALYYGKKKGKNISIIFDDSIKLQEEKRIKLSNLLKFALDKNEFFLVYQPIFDLKTRRIVSVEALLRWKNGNELIPPSEFIPILEETGMIRDVGRWVIEEACKQIKIWSDKGLREVAVSVNIDIQQILEDNFVTSVTDMIKKYCVKSGLLKFEITESEAMKFPETVIQTLKKLSYEGIEISIDDFGTGYSSLSYLKMMPVGNIKIDRSFVKDLPEDKDDRILTKAIIDLSKNFGYRTTAEGVETREQLIFLKEIGCNFVQGYYFSKPVSPDEVEQLITNENEIFRHKWIL